MHKSGQQDDFEKLSRASYHADAVRKAQEQEALDSLEQTRNTVASPDTVADNRARQQASAAPRPKRAVETKGGAVLSHRSVLSRVFGRGASKASTGSTSKARPAFRPDKATKSKRGRPHIPVVLIVLAVIVGLYLVIFGPVDRQIAIKGDEAKGLSGELSWHVPGMPYYVLALGSDARPEDTVSRTDTMILVRVDPMGAKLTMVSIPRDTMVEIPGQGTQKINAAYAFGGAAGAVRAVHELTGVNISHVAVVHFDGLEQLVDYLGVVTVTVPVDVNDPTYTGLVLPAGTYEMDGHTALLFSRTRYGFALGDYQRQIDQRIVLQAVMSKILTLSPTALPGVVAHMGSLIGTSMRMYSLLPLMLRLKLAGSPTVYSATLPSQPYEQDGISYVVVDRDGMARMMDIVNAGGDPSTLG